MNVLDEPSEVLALQPLLEREPVRDVSEISVFGVATKSVIIFLVVVVEPGFGDSVRVPAISAFPFRLHRVLVVTVEVNDFGTRNKLNEASAELELGD